MANLWITNVFLLVICCSGIFRASAAGADDPVRVGHADETREAAADPLHTLTPIRTVTPEVAEMLLYDGLPGPSRATTDTDVRRTVGNSTSPARFEQLPSFRESLIHSPFGSWVPMRFSVDAPDGGIQQISFQTISPSLRAEPSSGKTAVSSQVAPRAAPVSPVTQEVPPARELVSEPPGSPPTSAATVAVVPLLPTAVAGESTQAETGVVNSENGASAGLQFQTPSSAISGAGDSTRNAGNLMVIQSAPNIQAPTQGTPPLAVPSIVAAGAVPTVSESPTSPPLTLESVTSQKLASEKLPDLADDIRAQLAKHYQRAIELFGQKADTEKRISELKAEKEKGPALIAEHRQLLAQPVAKADIEVPAGASVADLEKLRLVDEERAVEARRGLDAWETKAKNRAERKPQMLALIETTRKQLEEAENAIAGPTPEGEPPIVGAARRTEQESLSLLLQSQLELYRIEQVRYEALSDLFPLQRDLLARARNTAEKRLESWKVVLTDARREESARQAREAREKLRNAHPTLRGLAEENSNLTLRRKELQEFLNTTVTTLSAVNTELLSVEEKFRNVREKEDRVGLTTAIGLLLRNQRSHLPDPVYYRRLQLKAEDDIVRLQTEQMTREDERSTLADLESQVDITLGEHPVESESDPELRQMTVELLTDRRQYLDDILADFNSCLQSLGETDIAARRLEKTLNDYQSYIDERVLWIRSASPAGTDSAARLWVSIHQFLSHRQWVPLIVYVMADAQSFWPLYGLLVAGIVLVVSMNERSRRFVADLRAVALKQPGAGIPSTLLATALIVAMASPWPALMWFAGWRLSHTGLSLATALSVAFVYCAGALWLVESFRKLCRAGGVIESFLEWPQTIVGSLHTNLMLYIAVGLPLTFTVVVTSNLDDGSTAESPGRTAFISFCVLLAVTLRRMVRPDGRVIGDFLRARPNSLMYRLRWIWYPLAVGSPLSLALMSLMGYEYTAEQLMVRLQLTLGLSIVLVISYTMVMQWMLAARRNLSMIQARARRAALAAAQRDPVDEAASVSAMPPAETPVVDISRLNQQMLHLVRGTACILFLTVSWGIWSQVLPALQVFSRVELWQVVLESTEQISGTADAPAIREITRVAPITLGDLLLALVVLSAAIFASRNLPGFLELAVLQKLPMDHGGRNAIATLCRYGIMLAGSVIAFNTIGIGWGSVQWLVAALTVGLGFGLQEIFANFVSGLIILFERPIRIGDIVTIDGISGCVSRIQIRATTITDWDRKEYIVPNKEFVTGKVLNWTLSDRVNRVVINVGVAYGSNVELAMELMTEVAGQNPSVLKEPPPTVGFEEFGESCLNLVLRCYLPVVEQRLCVVSQLHVSINQRFQEAGIEIAFPQRDLHIRSLPPGFGVVPGIVPQQVGSAANEADRKSGNDWKRSA